MQPFSVYVFYVSWGSEGKRRPVLAYSLDSGIVRIYPITTQYESKSDFIRKNYFKINDWQQAGLDRQSYVDTGTRINQPIAAFDKLTPIGTLTAEDQERLLGFLTNR